MNPKYAIIGHTKRKRENMNIANRLDSIGERLGTYLNEETETFSPQWFAQNLIVFGGLLSVVALVAFIENPVG